MSPLCQVELPKGMGFVAMSAKDLQRIEELTEVLAERRSVASAATVLTISDRQVNRLLVFVDDATSRLMQLRFLPSESTESYFAALRGYLHEHGCPVTFYSDKHSVFRVVRV